jgi:hypothetical protein
VASFSDKPWGSMSESDYKDANQFCTACLIDLNPTGQEKTKANCTLPVKETTGADNRKGIHTAPAVLAGARGAFKCHRLHPVFGPDED